MTQADDPAGMLTFHAHVPLWEIDANNHWNTMFYIRAFQAASERFAIAQGGAALASVRHVRFFRELHALDTLEIRSFRLPRQMAPYSVVHLMRHATTGVLCASALDQSDEIGASAPDLAAAEMARVAPRSLEAGRHVPVETLPMLSRGMAKVTHVGVLRPADFDHDGALTMNAAYSRVSDGTGHLWQHIGVSPEDFSAIGRGRANVELKLTRHQPCAPGDVVQLVSWFGNIRERSFELSHQLEEVGTGRVLASNSNITMVIDVEARRAVALPPFLVKAFAALPG